LGSCKEINCLEYVGLDRKDNIKTDLEIVGRGGVDWINLPQGRDK
jgi:hypothetical protein